MPRFVTAEQLALYTGSVADGEKLEMQELFCRSAEEIVCNYLGYPVLDDGAVKTFVTDGTGTNRLKLSGKPIVELDSVVVGTLEVKDFLVCQNEFAYLRAGAPLEVFPKGSANVIAVFRFGWEADTLPAIISMAGLRVASLLQTEAEGNIGITSKSFGDAGTRSFLNYTNYDKYLEPISKYRLFSV